MEEKRRHNGKFNPFIDTLKSVVHLLIQEREKKRRCILLHGNANSGKTTFLKILGEIFKAYDERATGQRFGLQIRSLDRNPSVCTSDEWKLTNLNANSIDETKRKLEGHGTIHEEKG